MPSLARPLQPRRPSLSWSPWLHFLPRFQSTLSHTTELTCRKIVVRAHPSRNTGPGCCWGRTRRRGKVQGRESRVRSPGRHWTRSTDSPTGASRPLPSRAAPVALRGGLCASTASSAFMRGSRGGSPQLTDFSPFLPSDHRSSSHPDRSSERRSASRRDDERHDDRCVEHLYISRGAFLSLNANELDASGWLLQG